ncbi:MAG: hypothetical protein M1416_01285 [Candidatus Pacearchaeota archaeon]|nr:hypothetical protein [Candidatus Pacearchaeota archaeon]
MTLLTDSEIAKLKENEEKDKRLNEEELFEKYFLGNITLDNDREVERKEEKNYEKNNLLKDRPFYIRFL